MNQQTKPAKPSTRETILAAAADVLRAGGFNGFSTREVAAAAGVRLSQIHYHFRSKEGLVLALFERQNEALVERQDAMFADPAMSLAEKWAQACNYLDEDLASGYVRILLELWAAGWSDTAIGDVVRASISQWTDLLTRIAREAEAAHGPLDPFSPEEVAALVSCAFIGAEAFVLLELERESFPARRALRRVGEVIAARERGGA